MWFVQTPCRLTVFSGPRYTLHPPLLPDPLHPVLVSVNGFPSFPLQLLSRMNFPRCFIFFCFFCPPPRPRPTPPADPILAPPPPPPPHSRGTSDGPHEAHGRTFSLPILHRPHSFRLPWVYSVSINRDLARTSVLLSPFSPREYGLVIRPFVSLVFCPYTLSCSIYYIVLLVSTCFFFSPKGVSQARSRFSPFFLFV